MKQLLGVVSIVCLVLAVGMVPVSSAHDGQIERYLDSPELLTQNVDEYNSVISQNADQVPSALRNRVSGETVNIEIVADTTYRYSVELDDELRATNLTTEHNSQATVLIRTELATLQSIKHAGNPEDAAKQAYVVDDIAVDATNETSTTEKTVLGAAELTKTVASDETEVLDFPGKETAVSVVDKTASSASDIGSRVISGLGF